MYKSPSQQSDMTEVLLHDQRENDNEDSQVMSGPKSQIQNWGPDTDAYDELIDQLKVISHFSNTEIGAQFVLYAIATYMLTTAPTSILMEFADKAGSFEELITSAMLAPWAIEFLKGGLTFSGELKEDYKFYWKSSLAQNVLLVAWAMIVDNAHLTANSNSIGFAAWITVPAMLMKVIVDFLIAPYFPENLRRRHQEKTGSAYAGNFMLNFIALHFMRLTLLFCATVAGGALLGEYLSPMITAFFLTHFAEIIAFSAEFNEDLGVTFFWLSGLFLEKNKVFPNYVSRIMMTALVCAAFQAWSPFQSETLLNTFINVLITFIADLVTQAVIVPKAKACLDLDNKMKPCYQKISDFFSPVTEVVSKITDPIDHALTEVRKAADRNIGPVVVSLSMKSCTFAQTDQRDSATYNPVNTRERGNSV